MDSLKDKSIERDRYERRAIRTLQSSGGKKLGPDGALAAPLALRRPHEIFEQRIRAAVGPNTDALDVCCGTGLFSLIAAGAGARVAASDIAEHNLELAKLRAARAGVRLETLVADAERLPLPDGSFNLITCSGSLSYVDLDPFLAEVRRLLRPGGRFVCIDSLNHNPIYRLNRSVQYWRGRRSKSTLMRMPTQATIAQIMARIGPGEVSYHGCFSFLATPARLVFGEERAARWLDSADDRLPWLKPLAFKFVLSAQKSPA